MAPWYFIFSFIISLQALGAKATFEKIPSHYVIKLCGQDAEWPPYFYFEKSATGSKGSLAGYSVEFLEKVLSKHKIKYKINAIPWVRCKEGVREGKYDMMMDTSNNAEREQLYEVSKPYYAMRFAYFYNVRQPQPAIEKVEDLKNYSICAVLGYNYAPLGLTEKDIDQGAYSVKQLMQKIENSRCDLAAERLEIILGNQRLGRLSLKKSGIKYAFIPGAQPQTFHMMISKNFKYKEHLLKIINEGILEMQMSGEAAKLGNKYKPKNYPFLLK